MSIAKSKSRRAVFAAFISTNAAHRCSAPSYALTLLPLAFLQVFSIAIFAGDKGLQYLKTFPSSFEPDTKEEVLSFLDLVIQSVNQFFRDRLATNLYGAIIQVIGLPFRLASLKNPSPCNVPGRQLMPVLGSCTGNRRPGRLHHPGEAYPPVHLHFTGRLH